MKSLCDGQIKPDVSVGISLFFLVCFSRDTCIFSVPHCGIQKPQCGIHISQCGTQIPHGGTENVPGHSEECLRKFPVLRTGRLELVRVSGPFGEALSLSAPFFVRE